MRTRKARVEGVKFVTGWNRGVRAGKNLAQIADELGMNPGSASVRACILRKQLGQDENGNDYLLELQVGGSGRKLNIDELRAACSED